MILKQTNMYHTGMVVCNILLVIYWFATEQHNASNLKLSSFPYKLKILHLSWQFFLIFWSQNVLTRHDYINLSYVFFFADVFFVQST